MRLDIYPRPEFLAALDRWRTCQPGSLVMSRAEAVRRIVDDRLVTDGAYRTPRKRKSAE